MAKVKKTIFRIAIVVFILLLLTTLLSKTIYRIMLPQVSQTRLTKGDLRSSITLSTVLGAPVDNSETTSDSGENKPITQIYSARLSLSFQELKSYLTSSVPKCTVNTLDRTKTDGSVDVEYESYIYDELQNRFIVSLTVSSNELPLEQGLPLTITVWLAEESGEYLLPINCVYNDSGIYYVYQIHQSKTIWGMTSTVQRVDVEFINSNYQNASINFSGDPTLPVVCYPSKPLSDGAVVVVLP